MDRLLLPAPILLPPRLNPYWAERFTILGQAGGVDYKLFRVLFTDRGGGVFVTFPYFQHANGIAAVATLPPSGRLETEVDLKSEGRLTSYLVKYSHHVDGRVHFSQDGKVRTELVKQSVPLHILSGHMFTIYLNGLSAFTKTADAFKLSTTKKGGVILSFPEGDPGWIKIVGFWYSREWAMSLYRQFAVDGNVGPVIPARPELGNPVQRVLLGPWNKGAGGKAILALEVQSLPDFSRENGPTLVFIGGFDDARVVNDPAQATTMLMFRYPAAQFEELQEFMESIDYYPAETPVGTIDAPRG